MNKTTTRLAATGGVIVLGAFALVLAQSDARKREREQPQIEPFAAQVAVPIAVDDSDGPWRASHDSPPKQLLVRANNDQLTRYGASRGEDHEQLAPSLSENDSLAEDVELPSELNPLRSAADALLDQSQVVLAAADVPVEPAAAGRPSTSSPPAWLREGGSGTDAASPTDLKPLAPIPNDRQAPSLPTFPISQSSAAGGATPAATAPGGAPLPSMAAPLPTFPPTLSSDAGDMSDVQRGALPATNMLPAAGLAAAGQVPSPAPSPAPSQPQTPGNMPSQFPAASSLPSANLSTLAAPLANEPGAPVGNGYNPPGARPQTNPANLPDGRESQPLRTAALAGLVSNQPGNRYLDGSQNPNMLIQKRAPEEIQVGKKATFVIAVRNAGNATAHAVRVVDSVPQGARFVESLPPTTPNAEGLLNWDLGEMAAGDERTITLQIVPEVQGEVGSNALVYFAAQASVRTVATLPKLELQLQSQPDMLIASRQQLSVIVKNTGTGVARGVRLEADLPELIKHDSGEAQLAASLGDMRPNDVQPITLDVTAVAAGQSQVVIRAVSEDGAVAEETVALQVMAPALAALIEGPKLRYLERQATYQIKVKNTGTAAATNLDFVVHLPAGLKYNSANNRGTYDPAQHTVSWGLFELPAGEIAPIELTVLPVELGPQAIAFTATGDLGLKAEAKGTVTVDGLAELAFTIGQDNGTIETGASSTYSVQVTNVGNKADKDVRLAVQLPNGSKLLKVVDAQVNYREEGNQIIFDPIPEMRNKDQYTYRFQIQHNQPGTQIVRTQLTSANWPVAVIKEEGTLVYNDQN
jgi:uncharacterized repeat protein (TIGR01451 family)